MLLRVDTQYKKSLSSQGSSRGMKTFWLNRWWSDEKVCSYYNRTSCVNNIVEKYIFSSEPELVKKCPPLCETTEYKVTQSRYNDPRDDRILRRRFNLGPEYKGNISRIFAFNMIRLKNYRFQVQVVSFDRKHETEN